MYICIVRTLLITVALLTATKQILAQATALYPYATVDNHGFDSINVGNLDVHFAIPIFNKPGRGIPFSYNLGYDNSLWKPSAGAWQPTPYFGWNGMSVVQTGFISFDLQNYVCDLPLPQHGTFQVYQNWVYHDTFGVSHPFQGTLEYDPKNCDQSISSFTETAQDGSGLTLTATRSGGRPSSFQQISTPKGTNLLVPTSSGTGGGSITDANGNQVSVSASGVYTDTTGTTVMTPATLPNGNITLTYPAPPGGSSPTASYTVVYTNQTVQTNFGCTGLTDYPATSSPLISEIDLPDSSKYLFTYEATPGHSGSVTGRIATVTLPTGGQIAYTYSGANGGVNCTDGSNLAVTRTMTNDPATSTWSYVRTPTASTSTTAVTDGLHNSLAYTFVYARQYYETSRTVYSGISTVLLTRQTCYNGIASPCTTTPFNAPITQMDT